MTYLYGKEWQTQAARFSMPVTLPITQAHGLTMPLAQLLPERELLFHKLMHPLFRATVTRQEPEKSTASGKDHPFFIKKRTKRIYRRTKKPSANASCPDRSFNRKMEQGTARILAAMARPDRQGVKRGYEQGHSRALPGCQCQNHIDGPECRTLC